MTTQFKNMNELVEYLNVLEQRVQTLETKKANSPAAVPVKASVDENLIARYVEKFRPRTNLVAPNFLKRAFAVWGHFFVANLLIGLTLTAILFCLTLVTGTALGTLIQNLSH